MLKKIFFAIFCFFSFFGLISADNLSDYYSSEDLSDYFGTMKACDKEGGENDCRNGNEYKFYLKLYDIYYLYQNKYNVKLDLPLIVSALYYGDEQLPTVYKNNLNNYNRADLKNKNKVTNLDWEYDFKSSSCYQYLNSNDSSYDMQILAKGMVTKKITYSCSDGSSGETKDVETSNYSKETLECENGDYDKDSVKATYELDLDKYDKFLLEYIKYKYHTAGSDKKCDDKSSVASGDYSSDINFLTGNFSPIHYYNQGDYGEPYGSYGTIATHGCGPTSLAIVISSITGVDHDPVEITNYVCEHGGCTGGGTAWANITSTGEDYGLDVTNTSNRQEVIDALGKGDSLVIVIMCAGHFTSGGHFIVLTGVTSDGKVTVADPASRDRSTEWDFDTVAGESCGGGNYWIMKKGS